MSAPKRRRIMKEDVKDIGTLHKDVGDLRKGLNEIFSAIKNRGTEDLSQRGVSNEFREFLMMDLQMAVYYLKKVVKNNPFNERYAEIEDIVYLISRLEQLMETINGKRA